MWKVSPKTPHTQFLCRVQFYKLPLKSNRVWGTVRIFWGTVRVFWGTVRIFQEQCEFLRNRASFLKNRASFLRNRASFCGIVRVLQENFQKKLEIIEKGSICIQRSITTLWSTYTQWSVKIRLPVTPVTASFIFWINVSQFWQIIFNSNDSNNGHSVDIFLGHSSIRFQLFM